MQKVVLIALTLPYVWVTLSYILAFMEKTNPLEDLSGCVVSVPIFAIVGYITQNSVRSASFNKYQNTTILTNETENTQEIDGR